MLLYHGLGWTRPQLTWVVSESDTKLWHVVSLENKDTKAIYAKTGQRPSPFLRLCRLSLSLSLASHSRSNSIYYSVPSSHLKRDLKWPAHVPTGGLKLIYVGATAELRLSCLNMSRQMKGRTKLMAQTSAAFSFLWNVSVMPGFTRGSYKAKAIMKRREGSVVREEVCSWRPVKERGK